MEHSHIIQVHHPSGLFYEAFRRFSQEHQWASFFQSDDFFRLIRQWEHAEAILLVALARTQPADAAGSESGPDEEEESLFPGGALLFRGQTPPVSEAKTVTRAAEEYSGTTGADPEALPLDAPDPDLLPPAAGNPDPDLLPPAAGNPDLDLLPPTAGNPDSDFPPHADEAPDPDAAKGPDPDAAKGPGPYAAKAPTPDAAKGPGPYAAKAPAPDAAKGPDPDAAKGPGPYAAKAPTPDATKDPGSRWHMQEDRVPDMVPSQVEESGIPGIGRVVGSLLAVTVHGKKGWLRRRGRRTLVFGGPLLGEGSRLDQETRLRNLLNALNRHERRQSLSVHIQNFRSWGYLSPVFRDLGFSECGKFHPLSVWRTVCGENTHAPAVDFAQLEKQLETCHSRYGVLLKVNRPLMHLLFRNFFTKR
jgi:hypothetical protein